MSAFLLDKLSSCLNTNRLYEYLSMGLSLLILMSCRSSAAVSRLNRSSSDLPPSLTTLLPTSCCSLTPDLSVDGRCLLFWRTDCVLCLCHMVSVSKCPTRTYSENVMWPLSVGDTQRYATGTPGGSEIVSSLWDDGRLKVFVLDWRRLEAVTLTAALNLNFNDSWLLLIDAALQIRPIYLL